MATLGCFLTPLRVIKQSREGAAAVKDRGLWCLGSMREGGSNFEKVKRTERRHQQKVLMSSLESLNTNGKEPESNGGLSNSRLPIYKRRTLASALPPVSVQGIQAENSSPLHSILSLHTDFVLAWQA